MTDRVALIDADIVLYRAASANQQTFAWGEGDPSVVSDLQQAIAMVDEQINRIAAAVRADKITLCLTDRVNKNFRKEVYELYKHNRKSGSRPVLLAVLEEYVEDRYKIVRRPTLEADDCLGILATCVSPDARIVCSDDKDLRQIPGRLYVPRTGEKIVVSPVDANRAFYRQVVTGDATDGYPGARGHGPKSKFVRRLSRSADERWMWAHVLLAHRRDVGAALVQARCARILRSCDWDWQAKKARLWTPP